MTLARSVVVTNTSTSWGGNEAWALQVARGLASRGHQVRFLWSDPVVGDRVAASGLAHAPLRLRADADAAGLVALARHLTDLRADAVLLTRWREYLLGGLAARLAGRPRTVLRLGLRITPRGDLKRRLIVRLADRIIVNAPEVREALVGCAWIDARKIVVVHNGLDPGQWRPRWQDPLPALGQTFRADLGIGSAAPLVLNVGALTPQKDHATLLRAFAQVAAARPDARLVILGEGFLRADLEAQVAALGLEERALLPGFRADPTAAFAAADLFVLSSDNEGMARVLLEAAASGLPIVATDVSGVRACVDDGRSGRIVPAGDADALASAIEVLLDDPASRRAMGACGRHLVASMFTESRMLDAVEQVLFA